MKKLVHSTQFTANKTKIINILFLCTIFYALFTGSAFAQTSTPSATIQESSSTSAVRDKVRQTIENLTHKPKAAIGNLEQVSDSTLQIKGEDGKLMQVATSDKTSYTKVTKDKKSDIKFTDLAIGDYIVALGFKNGNEVLDARRVISYDEKTNNKALAFWAEVNNNSKGILKVTLKNQEEWTIETNKNTQIMVRSGGKITKDGKVDDFIGGDRIIAIGTLSEKNNKTLVANKIIALSSLATKKPSASPKATIKPTASQKPTPTPTN